ncbi:hypothetical protein BJY24_004306 [Nocardia transvalensis]|uniref:Condensation domain-containing protein n=1 Tax=Nocardia transvalensis TaxID=37333 RepID=A0A7W9UJF0_9NOCA|nr:hypothetical protein [Nocardia transvalensis]MBB5915394.1 hypothetical protein [Nocardia transvalensis]
MVDLGWNDVWRPRAGRLTTWTVLPSARAAMLRAPVCAGPVPSWQQRYMRATHRLAGTNCPHGRLHVVEFDIDGYPRIAAMTRAVTALVRRHDMFRSWLSVEPDDRVVRHMLDPDDVELVATVRWDVTGAGIGEMVRTSVPDALHWDCFGFGVIEHEHSFTTYVAVDRLHRGGLTAVSIETELRALYRRELCDGGGRSRRPADYCRSATPIA